MSLILSLFMHIVDDYYLQGWLASAKQKKYWKENAPQEIYKYDYIWALIMHSFSWSFMVMLPYLIFARFDVSALYYVLLVVNTIIHCIVDNAKANMGKLNLIQDQLIHMAQIVVTFVLLNI